MHPSIRPIESRHRTRWEPLWDGYTRFYEREPREDVTAHLWNRLMDARYSITRQA